METPGAHLLVNLGSRSDRAGCGSGDALAKLSHLRSIMYCVGKRGNWTLERETKFTCVKTPRAFWLVSLGIRCDSGVLTVLLQDQVEIKIAAFE